MATWRLTAKHYMNVTDPRDPDNPIEWIYEETDQASGRRLRKRFKVPMFLDPEDAYTVKFYGFDGEIRVALEEGKTAPMRGALLFHGDPTPDMEPLDEEAEEISRAMAVKRQDPMGEGAFPGNGQSFGDTLFAKLSAQLDAVLSNNPIPKGNPAAGNFVTQDQLAEVMRQLALVSEENATLKAKLAEVDGDEQAPAPVPAKPKAEPLGRRM